MEIIAESESVDMAWEGKYLNMMNQWLILKQEEKSIDRYLRNHGYNVIAVYGMGLYGRHVIRELQGSDVRILYGIDRKKMKPYKDIEVVQPMEGMLHVDAIINTVLHDHISIKSHLAELINSPVLSLDDIIFESYN